MRYSPTGSITPALVLLGVLAAGACERTGPTNLEPALEPGAGLFSMHEGDHEEGELDAHARRELAALRHLTAPFHDIQVAMDAGWNTPVTACLSDPSQGAMGVHYGNLGYFDADAVLLEPETLLYEPRKNGGMRLVGIEYLIPFDALPASADPPELLGQHFHANMDAGVWALHVWLWRHNPAGLFADWNRKVTCAWAGGS